MLVKAKKTPSSEVTVTKDEVDDVSEEEEDDDDFEPWSSREFVKVNFVS